MTNIFLIQSKYLMNSYNNKVESAYIFKRLFYLQLFFENKNYHKFKCFFIQDSPTIISVTQ